MYPVSYTFSILRSPCSICSFCLFRYKVEEINFLESQNLFGLILVFDNVVEKTISNWQIEPVTLLTRIGGIIGVGKELLWVMIITGSFVTLAVNHLRQKDAK